MFENYNKKIFWQEQQGEYVRAFKQKVEKYYDYRRGIWQNLIIVIATILGFSLGLTSVTGGNPNLFLKITWFFQILAIIYGFSLLIVDNEINLRKEKANFEFSYDMSEISIMESDGRFIDNEELRIGLIVSAIEKLYKTLDHKGSNFWSEYAKNLIKKYSDQLPSNKIFIKKEKESVLDKFINWTNSKILMLNFLFFFIIILSFIFLLFAIFN
jgi:ABC-type multidrug transport system permease subunit